MTLIGANFPTSGFTAEAIFYGIASTSAIITDASTVTATWALGVPVTTKPTASISPVLKFTETATGFVYFATIDAAAAMANSVAITSMTPGVTCSFAGGCLYEVNAPGLASTIKKD